MPVPLIHFRCVCCGRQTRAKGQSGHPTGYGDEPVPYCDFCYGGCSVIGPCKRPAA